MVSDVCAGVTGAARGLGGKSGCEAASHTSNLLVLALFVYASAADIFGLDRFVVLRHLGELSISSIKQKTKL